VLHPTQRIAIIGGTLMLHITVQKPAKSESSYRFAIDVIDPKGRRSTIKIGIEKTNFTIRHAPVWDTYYPLMFITRNGGPLYRTVHSEATIRFDYEASRQIVEFFKRRAANFALTIDVASPMAEIGLDAQTAGELLLFGGGKDSRLLLGMLRETGSDPVVVSANGDRYAADVEGARIFSTVNSSMPNRIVPALMMLPKTIYHGAALGEVHETTPWHQYMDISTPFALAETSALLKSLGIDTTFEVPLAILPYNVVQRILAARYPELYKHQKSVNRNSRQNKTLHVALCKIYHGLDALDCCDPDVLHSLAAAFVDTMTAAPENVWGYRRNYEVIAREIRSILLRVFSHKQFPLSVPSDWDEDWIDHIHSYIAPSVDRRFTRIYRQYAEELDHQSSALPDPLKVISLRVAADHPSASMRSRAVQN
jgi:hypothetical protein